MWLPSSYSPKGPGHAVLYMHDGQNLFDKATAGYGMEMADRRTLDRRGSETLDAIYARYQKCLDMLVERRGYRRGRNWISRNFPGQAHIEISWSSLVDIPLQFCVPRWSNRPAVDSGRPSPRYGTR